MNGDIIDMVVSALRDTASKATETILHKGEVIAGAWPERPQPDWHSDKYTRDWIAGRLLGMADIIEAATKKRDGAGNP